MEVSLYFHFPFCSKKCPYCHFYVVPNRDDLKKACLEGMDFEWKKRLSLLANKTIVSIYFGGGTPLLFPEGIEQVLEWVFSSSQVASDCEITIEANPENLNVESAKRLKKAGVNRFSIGVQSLDNRFLQTLGREHTAERAIEMIGAVAAIGFTNLSIDLMYDLPNQTLVNWEKTLEQALTLPIAHVSLYNLTIEPHTLFFQKREALQRAMPQEELSLALLEAAVKSFESRGLKRYEISAFGKPSRHNSGYWTGRPFLGLGPSAYSYWEGKRWANVSNVLLYRKKLGENKSAVGFEEELSQDKKVRELLAIRLRLLEGVDLRGWDLPIETQKTLERLVEWGYVTKKEDRVCLTERGKRCYDAVAEEII